MTQRMVVSSAKLLMRCTLPLSAALSLPEPHFANGQFDGFTGAGQQRPGQDGDLAAYLLGYGIGAALANHMDYLDHTTATKA